MCPKPTSVCHNVSLDETGTTSVTHVVSSSPSHTSTTSDADALIVLPRTLSRQRALNLDHSRRTYLRLLVHVSTHINSPMFSFGRVGRTYSD